MARVIAVASAKGGVGKTTTTATLGTTLAAAGARVAAIDADLGMANLANALGVDADEATVHDVLAGRADAEAAMYDGPAGLTVVPGDTDLAAFPEADPTNLRKLLDEFTDFDYVLLDTGAGLSHDSVLPLGLADDVLLVTNPDPNAIGDTEKTRQVVERLDGSVAGAVVTRVDPNRLANGDVLATGLDAPVLATVPSSPLVNEAAATGEPVSLTAPTSDVAAAYRELTRELTGVAIPEPEVESDDDVDDDADVVDESDDDAAEVDADEEDTEDDDSSALSDTDEDEEADELADAAEDEAADADSADGVVVEEAKDAEDAEDAAEDAEDDHETADSDTEADDEPADRVDADADAAEGELDETAEGSEDEDAAEPDAETAEATADEDDADSEADEATADDADSDESAEDADHEADEADDDVLVPDAEDGEPVDEVEQSEPDDDDGVYETSLVEEAEANGVSVDEEDAETKDEDDDDGGSGFLGRLLG